MYSMRSVAATYRQRLMQEWPRVVVALVSLYGIYYAANVIQSTSQQIQALGTFTNHQYPTSPSINSTGSIPIDFTPSQLLFKPSNKPSTTTNTSDRSPGDKKKNHKHHNGDNDGNLRHYLEENYSPPLFGQIRLFRSSPNNDIDFDGHHEAAAIYTLLVISSLSIIDNAIGLMVATRRSLRLTQIAFAIWCLRFLFRILSLVSVLFMLVAGADFQNAHHLPLLDVEVGVGFTNSDSNGSKDNIEHPGSTMIMLTVLEVVVAAVHGWSLMVLIRDLRNQPRPKTVLARTWHWFCNTKWGRRLGLSTREGVNNSGIIITQGGIIVGFGDVENGNINNSSVWDREIAASLGLSSGLLSSGSSIRSVAATIPEMIVVGTSGRSRASSISSFSSSEKGLNYE
ncbi:hypothetical protein BGZ49_010435 [Haplosporangium sp. Z 27]|nr:hypothetical protein BGZ49_010435 [Haplosporangium sp. Z 27]